MFKEGERVKLSVINKCRHNLFPPVGLKGLSGTCFILSKNDANNLNVNNSIERIFKINGEDEEFSICNSWIIKSGQHPAISLILKK